jgi:prophage antirepressor-like protein
VLTFKVNEAEKARLEATASAAGLGVADTFRGMINGTLMRPGSGAANAERPSESAVYLGDVAHFEGHEVRFYALRGRICVVAADLGFALGYARNGKKLVDVIREKWADEFLDGEDFTVLTGADLRLFAETFATHQKWAAKVRHLMVLYESGVDGVCLKTEKPAGRRLRRYLRTEILPKLRRGEAALPGAEPPPVFASTMPAAAPALPPSAAPQALYDEQILALVKCAVREELAVGQPSSTDRLLARMDLRDALIAEVRTVIAQVSTEDAERAALDLRRLLGPLIDGIDEIRDRSDAQFEAIKGVGFTVAEVRGRSGNLDARMTRLIEALQRPQGRPEPDDTRHIAALSPPARVYFQAVRHAPLDHYTLLVAYHLALWADDTGKAPVDFKKIEAALSIAKDGVVKCLGALLESGWLDLIPDQANFVALRIPHPWK